MRIFNPESFQQHFRITVRNVVAILVGIKQQVRRIRHIHAAPSDRARCRDVEFIDEHFVLVVHTVAVRVFMDADSIRALEMIGRRGRDPVVDRSQKRVATDHFQAGGVRVLTIFHQPHPASFVPCHEQRLSDVGIAEHQLDRQVVRRVEVLHGFGGAERIRISVAASDILFHVIDSIDFQIHALRRRIGIAERLSGIEAKVRRSRGRPRRIISRTILPDSFESQGLLRGFVHQHRRSDAEIRSRIVLKDSNGYGCVLTAFHQRRIDCEPSAFSESAAELRRKRAGGSDRLTRDECGPGIIQCFHKQSQRLPVPFLWHFDERSIP